MYPILLKVPGLSAGTGQEIPSSEEEKQVMLIQWDHVKFVKVFPKILRVILLY